MSFFKNYFRGEKHIGIFQSIILVIFLLFFSFILFYVFSKSKKYYEYISFIPLDKKKENHEV